MNGKTLLALAVVMALSGCASVERYGYKQNSEPAIDSENCNVTVYQSYTEARRGGEIEELCSIAGSSSPSFIHTVEVAVNKHKHRACECGATNFYIKDRKPSGWSVAEVTMIAFKYITKK